MSQILRLDYACTAAEWEQAERLSLRQQLGGGSKWRMWLVFPQHLPGGIAGGKSNP